MGSVIQPINVTFQATGVPQVQGAFNQLTQSSGTFSRSFVEANGRVSAFGRQSVTAMNATGFAISQLATTGNVGFKSLASSVAGFASFFGAGGLIASGVISLGLILTDFWNRQRREIEETRKKVSTELQAAIQSRRDRDDPVGVATDRLTTAQENVRAARAGVAGLMQMRQRALNDAERKAIDSSIEKEIKRVTAALNEEMEALRLVNDARKRSTDTESKEVAVLADAIRARQANNSQIQRANALMSQAQFILDQTKNASVEDVATMNRRAEAIKTLSALSEAFKRTQTTGASVTNDAQQALEKEIDALVQLGRAGQLSVADFARLIQLQQQFTQAVRDGTASLEERARASARGQQVDKAMDIPAVEVQRITERRTERAPGPAKTIELSEADRQKIRGEVRSVLPAAEISEMQEMFAASFASVIAGGIVQGFAMGLQQGGVGEGFRQMGAQILTGFGSILTQVGAKALEAALLSNTFFSALMANPVVAIGAAIGLTLLGQALGGRGGGGARGSAGFSAATNSVPIDIQRLVIDPNFRNPVERRTGPTIEVIGINEGRVSRAIALSQQAYNRRGG